MIDSEYVAPLVIHVARGPVTLAELAAGAKTTLKLALQHPKADPQILWDFRDGNLILEPALETPAAEELLKGARQSMSEAKRAIVTNSPETKQLVNDVIARIQPPWPWLVFVNREAAVLWLLDD